MAKHQPIIAISLLSEMAQAISHLNPDRALLFLTESAVSVTESDGAVLLAPHEKNSIMVPFVKSFQKDRVDEAITDAFLQEHYQIFQTIRENMANFGTSEYEISPRHTTKDISAWPVMLAGKPIAMLIMFKQMGLNEFSDEHRSFLEIITPFMGPLFDNYRMHNEMIHKNSRLSALYEISQQAESLINFRDVYDSLGKVAKSFINFDAYLLYFLSPDGATLEMRLSEGESESFPKTIKVGEGPVGLAAQEVKPYLTFSENFNSVLVLPIEVSDKLVAVIAIASRKAYAYRDEDIIGLRIIATQVASIDHMFKDLISVKGFTERILESMTSGVLFFDASGQATYANPELTRILGQPFPEGWSPYDLSENLPGQLDLLMIDVLNNNITLELERVKLCNTIPAQIVEVNAFPFRTEEGSMLGTAFFIKDATQICTMEEQLKRADKLSALGVLAAGIAHEIRNPLTGMKMIVQLLESEFSKDDSRREPLGILQKEIDRLENIIGNLLDFARPSKPKAIDVHPSDVLEDCFLLIKNQLHKQNIELEKHFSDENPVVTADPDQLKQVFINILTNAIQALLNGGILKAHIATDEKSVKVIIEDNGYGIPQDKVSDIFNPFMTTKEDGTGLGLSMAQRIVEEHGGRIEVSSILGEGSIFMVNLPRKSGD